MSSLYLLVFDGQEKELKVNKIFKEQLLSRNKRKALDIIIAMIIWCIFCIFTFRCSTLNCILNIWMDKLKGVGHNDKISQLLRDHLRESHPFEYYNSASHLSITKCYSQRIPQ